MTIIRWTLRVYVAAVLGAAGIASLTALTMAAGARRLLAFTFEGVPASLGTAAHIFLNNARLACVPLGFAFVLVAMQRAGPSDGWRRRARACRVAMDVVLAIGVLLNVAIIGAGIGAYGLRMVRGLLPHGPVEALAFATALAAYVHVRQERSPRWRSVALAAAGCMIALALAAGLETFLY